MDATKATMKITRLRLKVEHAQDDINILQKDLRYIQYPPLRAVAENMIQGKRISVTNLKTNIKHIQHKIIE